MPQTAQDPRAAVALVLDVPVLVPARPRCFRIMAPKIVEPA
jgi:hypothetical protein